jgi:hypothetical protein
LLRVVSNWDAHRLEFENALIICALLNRTLVTPPIEVDHKERLSLSSLLNFKVLNQVVQVVTLTEQYSYLDVINSKLGRVNAIFNHPVSEVDIISKFSQNSHKLLVLSNLTLNCEWKGSLQNFPQRRLVQTSVMYADHMKQVGRKMSEALGLYHAVHIAKESRKTRELEWWASSIAMSRDATLVVFVVGSSQSGE